MSMRTETINGYTVHFISDQEEALLWLKSNFGPKAQFVSYLARRDIFAWVSEIDEDFDGKQYLPADIMNVINTEDVRTLRKIHPQFFQYVKNELTEAQSNFLANNLTSKQIRYMPNIFFSKFYPNDYEAMLNTVDSVKYQPYTRLYTLKKTMAEDSNKTTFVRVEVGPIGAILTSKQHYAASQSKKNIRQQVDKRINMNLESVTDMQLAAYLDINVQYFLQLENRHSDSPIMEYMGLPENENGKRYFKMKDFKKYMQAVYVPSNPDRKNDPEYYLPEDGLYSASDLISMYGVEESNNIRSVNRAMRIGNLGHFDCSNRVTRISKKDFEEYLEKREEYAGKDYITKVFNRQVIQYPKKATPEQKSEVLSHYISEEQLDSIISTSDKVMGEGKVVNQYISVVRKVLMKYGSKYIDRDNANKENRALYFKRENIQEFFDDLYGYYKKTEDGFEVDPVKLDLNTLIKNMNDGADKKTYHMYPVQNAVEELAKKYPSIEARKIQWKIERMYKDGELPIMYLSKKTKYLYMPHVEANKELTRYLKEKSKEN